MQPIPWVPVFEAAVLSGIMTSLTDWLFAGDWLHPFYNRYPEMWRFVGGKEEGRPVETEAALRRAVRA